MPGNTFSKGLPQDNVYVIETADDLPEVLSQWTLYNLQFDPGSGAGLYFSPDGLSLVRLAAGGGGGGVASFNTRIGIVTSIAADYAGFYVDSFNTRIGAVVPLTGDYAGFYVDSFQGRTGAVVTIEDDYDTFYLVKGAGPSQTVVGDVVFTGDVEFNNIQGVKFGPSTEIELRNPTSDSTWFLQYTSFFCQFGVFGDDFQDIIMDFSNSFTHFRFGAPVLLQERAAAINGPSTFGQLWVRDDDPNILMFTDGNDDDWIVDVTAA